MNIDKIFGLEFDVLVCFVQSRLQHSELPLITRARKLLIFVNKDQNVDPVWRNVKKLIPALEKKLVTLFFKSELRFGNEIMRADDFENGEIKDVYTGFSCNGSYREDRAGIRGTGMAFSIPRESALAATLALAKAKDEIDAWISEIENKGKS